MPKLVEYWGDMPLRNTLGAQGLRGEGEGRGGTLVIILGVGDNEGQNLTYTGLHFFLIIGMWRI